MTVRLFTDLNCPFCYATEFRIEELGLSDRVEWRGVEHEPDLPVPIDVEDEAIRQELADEVASVTSRAPEVPIALPPGKANTGPGLLATAAALRMDPDGAAALRRAVYQAFWVDGRDISSSEVLDEIARDHALPALAARREDDLTVASWRLEWERSTLRGVPLLVRDDGETLYGLKASDALAAFIEAAP
jgi:predicted DsbA family dithiol-disulfide isomerase